jgi:hypothetical protein
MTTSLKNIIFSILFALISNFVWSQKVFITQYEYQADVVVHLVNQRYQANMVVETVQYPYQAGFYNAKAHWCFVQYAYQADIKIFITNYAYRANWLVYFTKNGF